MALLKIIEVFLLVVPYIALFAEESKTSSHLLFLAQQGEHEKAIKIYQEKEKKAGHDFELLHQLGLKILDSGFQMRDPECQLLALFGAAISANEDAYPILEGSLKSRYPLIQMVAINALSKFQNDRADKGIANALGSSTLEVRYEALKHLCKKKYPLSTSQTESLMYKTPKELYPIYPPLFAAVGDTHSTRVLRKLMNHPSHEVRLAVILSLAKYEREDLLPLIRQQANQFHYALQEATAFALGQMKDEISRQKLEKLTLSQYPNVSLAAHFALYQLGDLKAVEKIESMAKKEDLFAISALGSIADQPNALIELLKHPNIQVSLNAALALLEQNHPLALTTIGLIIQRDKNDHAFTSQHSPGKAFKAWKMTPSASQILKDDLSAYVQHLDFKEKILEKISMLSKIKFIELAHEIFLKNDNELIPKTVELLQQIGRKEALVCLKEHQQQFGSPLVRNYCNLALFRLKENGPYADQLRRWVKAQAQTDLIRFKPFTPWKTGENAYHLSPEESSKLLIESFETFASQQDPQGIDILLEAIATGHPKNKYALAGLLLRATQ